MFPEGTRNSDGQAQVQPGAARIALQAGAAIVPVAVLNTDRARLWPPRFPQFRVAYGPPLDLSDLQGVPLRTAAAEATARWQRAVADLRRSLEG
jgi:1-acyl-sn-glycerol-3-phosphate acyltransferase